MPSKKNKLKSFGKDRRERKATTQYDADGNWLSNDNQHQDRMRQTHNALFDRYYRDLQNLGAVMADSATARQRLARGENGGPATASPPAAAAWEREMALFRTPLQTTVWVNDTDPIAPSIREHFENFAANITNGAAASMAEDSANNHNNNTSAGEALVEPIPWYPIPGMAWRILADKTAFRKHPALAPLRRYMIQLTAMGAISRQEEVSMIPPLLLDLRGSDVALDMCASPGSKTAQMLVALGREKQMKASATRTPPFPFDYLSPGMIVANELDAKRANMLVHQVKRLQLLFPFALFTNHDARFFPELPLPASAEGGETGGAPTHGDNDNNNGDDGRRFDKILCDVVCSGDGTLRKAPHVFKIWTPREGIALQKTQIQIALRAAHLLRVGGRLVYSTCSLNPIENEAVVAALVHRTGGALKLLESAPLAAQLLPDLPYSPGMTKWVVTDGRGNVVAAPGPFTPPAASDTAEEHGETTAEESEEQGDTKKKRGHKKGNSSKTPPTVIMHEALFPPGTPGGYDSPALRSLDLTQCMRFFPSHCKGGGFFIAVFEKVAPYSISKRDVEEFTAEGEAKAKTERGDSMKAAEAAAPHSIGVVRRARSGEEGEEDKSHAKEETAGQGEGESAAAPPPLKKPRTVPPQFVAAPESVRAALADFYHLPMTRNEAQTKTNSNSNSNSTTQEAVTAAAAEVAAFPFDHLLVRTATGDRELRLTPSSVVSMMATTPLRVLQNKSDALLVVSAGLRALAHESLDKGWRITHEAAPIFAHFLEAAASPRLVRDVPVAFVEHLIKRGGRLKDCALEDVQPPALRGVLEAAPVGALLARVTLPPPTVAVASQHNGNDTGDVDPCCCCCSYYYTVLLRARTRVMLLVDHEDVVGMQLRLGIEVAEAEGGAATGAAAAAGETKEDACDEGC